MNPPRSPRRRKQPRAVRVPRWYYALLGGIALVGAILIGVSLRGPSVNTAGLNTDAEYSKGQPDAPVTIIEWGSFQ